MPTIADTKPRRPMRRGDPRLARHLPARNASPLPRLAASMAMPASAPCMQADEGESLDVQQRTIAGYAQMHGLAIEHVFVERGVSGSKPLADRPQGAALLAAIKPGDVVITPKLDRMFRSALDALDVLAKLKAAGIACT